MGHSNSLIGMYENESRLKEEKMPSDDSVNAEEGEILLPADPSKGVSSV